MTKRSWFFIALCWWDLGYWRELFGFWRIKAYVLLKRESCNWSKDEHCLWIRTSRKICHGLSWVMKVQKKWSHSSKILTEKCCWARRYKVKMIHNRSVRHRLSLPLRSWWSNICLAWHDCLLLRLAAISWIRKWIVQGHRSRLDFLLLW